jgi:hypothetical protein
MLLYPQQSLQVSVPVAGRRRPPAAPWLERINLAVLQADLEGFYIEAALGRRGGILGVNPHTFHPRRRKFGLD